MNNLDLNSPISQSDYVYETGILGNFKEPIKMEEIKVKIEQGRFAMAKWVIIASIGFILLFLIFSFIILMSNNCLDGKDPLERLIKVYLEIIPFWATITGTILGYHFIKKET